MTVCLKILSTKASFSSLCYRMNIKEPDFNDKRQYPILRGLLWNDNSLMYLIKRCPRNSNHKGLLFVMMKLDSMICWEVATALDRNYFSVWKNKIKRNNQSLHNQSFHSHRVWVILFSILILQSVKRKV